MNRLSYTNPVGNFLTRRPDLVKAVGHIAIPNCTDPKLIDDVRNLNRTAQIWLAENVGMVLAKTRNGRWEAWHRWTDASMRMPAPRLARYAQDNYARSGLLYKDDARKPWPAPQVGCIAFALDAERGGYWFEERSSCSPMDALCTVWRDAIADLPIRGIQADCSLRALGFPDHPDVVGAPMADLHPLSLQLTCKQYSTRGVTFPNAEQWAGGRALESFFTPRQSWLTSMPEPDRLWCHYDGDEFGRSEYGYKHVAGPTSTLIYNPWSGLVGYQQRHTLAVGVFMMHASAEEGEGPWLAMHDTMEGGDWGGILAHPQLLEWARMKPTRDVIEIPKSFHQVDTPSSRVLVRTFEDDGGAKWSITVNLSAKDYDDTPALSARRVREQGAA